MVPQGQTGGEASVTGAILMAGADSYWDVFTILGTGCCREEREETCKQ